MSIIWPDFDENSEASRKLIRNKQINDETYWPTMREIFAYDCQKLPLNRFRLWASIHNVPLVTQYRTSRFFGETFYHAARDPKIAEVLQENWIGVPEGAEQIFKVADDFDTSMQRVQDVAHLVICGFTPEDLKNCKSILEIGGGYGDPSWLEEQFKLTQGTAVGVGFITWALGQSPNLLGDVLARQPAAVMLSFGDPRPHAQAIKNAVHSNLAKRSRIESCRGQTPQRAYYGRSGKRHGRRAGHRAESRRKAKRPRLGSVGPGSGSDVFRRIAEAITGTPEA